MPSPDYYLQQSGLDEIDCRLLQALAGNSRMAASSLAQVVGLTRQAVADRMERLRHDGIIRRYSLAVNADKIGLTVRGFVAITLLPACSAESELDVIDLLRRNPWVQECYRVTGEDYFQVRVVAPDIDALKDLVLDLRATGVVQGTRTMLALETLFEKTPHELISAFCKTDTLAPEASEDEEDIPEPVPV
jgi:Lrp/AsnC family leucine-responsive transcriptional regulator